DSTKNRLAKDGQYENITVHRHLMMPDFELLEDIESKLQPGGQQADCILPMFICLFDADSLSSVYGNPSCQSCKVFAPRDDEVSSSVNFLKKAAIVRYAYNHRSNPQVGAAFPCIKEKYECLLYVQLPFMEDLRQFTFPVLDNNKKFTPSESRLSAVDALIDSMMLVQKDDDGESVDVFKVNHIPNPQFQRLFQCLHHRGVNPDDPLPPAEPEEAEEGSRAAPGRVDPLPGPSAGRQDQVPSESGGEKKEQKTSADVFGIACEVSHFNRRSPFQVGSVNPVRDFCRQTVSFDQVCQQLTYRIEQLLGNRSPEYYMKSIACIQAFRDQSVSSVNAELFNSYMQSLKRSVADRNLQEFWDLLHVLLFSDALTLISKDEVDGSTISKQDANQFLVFEQKEKVQAAPAQDDTGDVDDLVSISCLFGCFHDKHIHYYICECDYGLKVY
uniref:Ku domain-containing protein n=1 Tax=Sinocyclocheilus rhinocerous TaxID=307959 RepID=A0A673HHB1_9TELE